MYWQELEAGTPWTSAVLKNKFLKMYSNFQKSIRAKIYVNSPHGHVKAYV